MEHDEIVEAAERSLVTAAKAALPGPATVVADLLAHWVGPTSTDRLVEAIQEEVHQAVFSRLPEVERQLDVLQRAGVSVNASDFGRVLEHFAKAWRTAADEKKRKLLEDAFVRSFDRELYESGLLNALWERLERLTYGDLTLLRDVIETSAPDVTNKHKPTLEHSLGKFHADNLKREHLCWTTVGDLKVTVLGRRLYDLSRASVLTPTDRPSPSP